MLSHTSSCGRVTLFCADISDVLDAQKIKPTISAIVTDPPYCVVRLSASLFDVKLFPEDIKCVSGALDRLDAAFPNIPIIAFASPDFMYPGRWGSKRLYWMPDNGKQLQYHSHHEILNANCHWIKAASTFYDSESTIFHRYEKPVNLMQQLIRLTGCAPDSYILDPFMGSGSTGVAAVKIGRRFIGVEKDYDHFSKAVERVGNALEGFK